MDFFKRFRQKAFIPPLGNSYYGKPRVRQFNDKQEQLTANVGWVYTVNDAIADAVAEVVINLKNKKDDSEVDNHVALDLWNNPNELHTKTQLTKLYVTYMNLTGENYILKSDEQVKGYPAALYIMPSQFVEFKLGKTIRDSIIEYNNNKYEYEQVIRDMIPDPVNPYKGRGVVSAAASAIDTDMSAIDYNRQFFANQARPSQVINVKNKLDDVAAKRFKQEIVDLHTGTDNAGKPLILEGDLAITPYGLSQREMDYLGSRKFTKDEIFAMFKTSPAMLGMTENVNRSNADAAALIFNRLVVVPRVKQLIDMLNRRLLSERDQEKYYFDFENPSQEDATQKLSEIDKGYNRWVTRNEARAEYGLDPVTGGDDFMQAQPPAPPVKNIKIDVPKKSEAKSELKKKLYNDPAERDEIGELTVGITAKNLNNFESEFGIIAREYFDKVNNEIQKKLKGTSKHFKKKAANDYMPNWNALERELIVNITPAYEILLEKAGATATVLATATTAYDIKDPQPQEYVSKIPKKVVSDVSEETEKQVRASLAQGLRDNKTTNELSADINEVLGLRAQARAQRIARTESVRTATFGKIDAWRQSGVVVGKEWYTSQDERVCPTCGPLDGKKYYLGDILYKDGEDIPAGKKADGTQITSSAYGDIAGPPIHANCRCDLLPLLEGEV